MSKVKVVKKVSKATVKKVAANKAAKTVKAKVTKATPANSSPLATAEHAVQNDSTLTSAVAIVAQASLLKVTDEASQLDAARMLGQLKTWTKQVEEKRAFLTKPLKEHVKRIEALFKPTIEKLDAADVAIRSKVLAYRAEAERKQVEETAKLMEKAEAEQEAGNTEEALVLATEASEMAAPVKSVMSDAGSMQSKKVWDFEVTDFGSIPLEYFTLDEKKVRTAIRAGQRDITGIRVFQKEQLAVSVFSGEVSA